MLTTIQNTSQCAPSQLVRHPLKYICKSKFVLRPPVYNPQLIFSRLFRQLLHTCFPKCHFLWQTYGETIEENTYFRRVLVPSKKEAQRAVNWPVVLLWFVILSGSIVRVLSPKTAILEAPLFSVFPNHALPLIVLPSDSKSQENVYI